MQLLTLLASAAVLAGTAQAHVRLTALNGVTTCVRLPPNNSPVTDVNSNNIVSLPCYTESLTFNRLINTQNSDL